MKYYKISEENLKELLFAYLEESCNELDGVDNWGWWHNSYYEIVHDYFPEKTTEELADEGYSFNDCVERIINDSYEEQN